MEVSVAKLKELREQCGAGIMDCRNALLETKGDVDRALDILKEKGLSKARKKAARATTQGVVDAYIHAGGRIGTMVEVNCETDFVARTDEFKDLAHHLAMQVAAMSPRFISQGKVTEGDDVEPEADCLLLQPYIKSPDKSVQDIITETIAKVGENIKVKRFARFEIGE